jgi:hypothetical protein
MVYFVTSWARYCHLQTNSLRKACCTLHVTTRSQLHYEHGAKYEQQCQRTGNDAEGCNCRQHCMDCPTILRNAKQSPRRPDLQRSTTMGLPEFRDIRHMKAVRFSPLRTGRLPPPPKEIYQVPISVRDCVELRAIVRPEGLGQWNITMIPTGIEPASFCFAVQCLNQPLTDVTSTKKLLV